MPVTADQPAPYAPASAIIDLIKRHRNKGLPTPVDSDVLARAGISSSLIPRTLQAMQTLDLLNENGGPTQILESLRLATEDDFKHRMVDWLQSAYADALTFVDPAIATENQIRDAFRSYRPIGQQPRMVSLFSGLFAAAGIAPEKKQQVARKPQNAAPKKPTPSTKPKVDGKPLSTLGGGLPPALSGLLSSLPAAGSNWTQNQRDKFLTTFEAVLDFCFPVVDPTTGNDDAGGDHE